MSVKLLFELKERLHYTAVAGILTAGEDFRLQNILRQFKGAAGASPVFAKIDGLLEPLRDPAGFTGRQLMEAASLVDAVCMTQAAGLAKAEPAPEDSEGPRENAVCLQQFKYSEVKPYLAALTGKGSGRYSVLWEAWQEKSRILNDYRLIPALIAGLGDSYSEMADLCMQILKEADPAIVSMLKRGLDPKGKKDMARRVIVIASLAKERENDYYRELVNDAAEPVRSAAIRALCFDSGNRELLAALAKSERGEAKKAALSALMKQPGEMVRECYHKLFKKDPALAAPYLFYLEDEETADLIGDQIYDLCVNQLMTGNRSKEEISKLTLRICGLINALPNQYSEKLFGHLAWFGRHEKELEPYGGEELLCRVNLAVTETVFTRPEPVILDAAIELANHSDSYLPAGILAVMIRDFAGSYDVCERWLKKSGKAFVPADVFDKLRYDQESRSYVAAMTFFAADWDGQNQKFDKAFSLGRRIDIRWIRYIMASGKWNRGIRGGANYYGGYPGGGTGYASRIAVLRQLTDPEDEEMCGLLKTYYHHYAMQGMGTDGIRAYLELGGTDCRGMFPALLKARPELARYSYQLQGLLELYDQLPMTREEKAQELLQTADRMEKQEIKGTNQVAKSLKEKALELLSQN